MFLPLPTFLAAGLVAFGALAQSGSPLPADRRVGAETITKSDLTAWLTRLTSPEFGGRGTGQEGFHLAATFVADHFAALGLLPFGDERDGQRDYWQRMPWKRTQPQLDKCRIVFAAAGKPLAIWKSGEGIAGPATNEQQAAGPVVLVRLREGEESKLDDVDLKDKFVLLDYRASAAAPAATSRPASGARGGRRMPGMGSMSMRSKLQQCGATAVVLVSDETYERQRILTGSTQSGAGSNPAARARGRMPNQLSTTSARLDELLTAGGIQVPPDQVIVNLGAITADLSIAVESSDAPAYNVVAVLPGADPQLKEEYVVIGSHLDHLGRSGNRYFPGADDDGSGTTGVLAVARAFAKNPTRPKRSILFVTFCGEELGLLGSAFFVQNPPIPLGKIVAELQMDMIGRDEEGRDEAAEANLNTLHLVGTKKLSLDLDELCEAHNQKHAGFTFEWDEEDVFFRSDHANFAKMGIPIAFFFTGFHRDYHQQTDTVEKINFDKLGRVATYVYDLGFELAQRPQRPLVEADLWEKWRKNLNAPENEPAAPVRNKQADQPNKR